MIPRIRKPMLELKFLSKILFATLMTGAEAHHGKFVTAHSSQFLEFDVFNCRGDESNVLECGRRFGDICQHNHDASVICS